MGKGPNRVAPVIEQVYKPGGGKAGFPVPAKGGGSPKAVRASASGPAAFEGHNMPSNGMPRDRGQKSPRMNIKGSTSSRDATD